MAAEDRYANADGAGDRFEEDLVVRLGERAREVSGAPPLAELRRAGKRRAKRRVALQLTAGAAVLALGLGGLTQLGAGGDGGASGRPLLAAGGGSPSPGAGSSLPFPAQQDTGQPISCAGPTSLRTPGWTGPPASSSSASSSVSSSATSSASSSASSSAVSSASGGPSGPPQGSASGSPSGPASSSASGPASGGPSTGSGSPSGRPATGAPSLPSGTGTPGAGPDASPGWTPPVAFSESPAGRAATAVWEAGQRYPDHYFGVCANAAENKVYAMRVPGSDFDQVVLAGIHNALVKVEFVDAVGSRRQVRELADRIGQDQADWKQRGVTISFVSVATDGAGVIVWSPQADTARADIMARYGRQVAEVRQR
ncbi:hypothetical protein ACFVHB_32715 [Kitasatospora sp. NPDC127111]|uniref:hypothetical protein n=1 Tax=Kitasatospora sp. NPDC127111 TaxID=3345363 RepID=UPI00362741FB